jgi:DNA-binding HxlR family transcriptional regulator
MPKKDLSAMECSIARTLEVIGERWSLLIVRDAFYGVTRFEDFHEDLGLARNVLTDRLTKLVDQGVLDRRQYESRPPRFEYVLTEKGRDLLPVVLAMMRWGDKWSARGNDIPVTLTHLTCGSETKPSVTCSECGEELHLRDLRAHPIRIKTRSRSAQPLAVA